MCIMDLGSKVKKYTDNDLQIDSEIDGINYKIQNARTVCIAANADELVIGAGSEVYSYRMSGPRDVLASR